MVRKTRRSQRLEMEKTIMVLTKDCSKIFFGAVLSILNVSGDGASTSRRRHLFKLEFLQLQGTSFLMIRLMEVSYVSAHYFSCSALCSRT